MRRVLSLLSVLCVLALSACGNGEDSPDEQAGGAGQQTYAEGDGDGIDAIKVTGKENAKPKLEFETPFKVEETSTKVLVEGEGEELAVGENMFVAEYVGVNGRNAKEFDSSWKAGSAMPFALEEAALIPGFVQGLDGQKVGSRVLIAMAPDDGYAEGNEQAGIKAGDSLVFVVDIVKSEPLLARADGKAVEAAEDVPAVTEDDSGVPNSVDVPDTGPGEKVRSGAVIEGSGRKVGEQDTVSFHYLAATWSDGEVLDSSWEQGRPWSTPVAEGSQRFFPGLTEALTGQTVGSRVVLVVPKIFKDQPDLAEQAGIEPDETVVFVVDIRGAVPPA